ncbi:MAG: hypothetical protein JNN15_06670 [Blastocatellia bacterium]|nr:hypothetical protein [Blastocatellia bacterium]
MKSLEVKKIYLPSRCEICHQSDLFDPVNNYCSRCSQALDSLAENPSHRLDKVKRFLIDTILIVATLLGVFGSLIIGLAVGYSIFGSLGLIVGGFCGLLAGIICGPAITITFVKPLLIRVKHERF